MLGSANKLKTARQISMSGAVSGSGSFDGSGNVNIVTTQANIAVLTGPLTKNGEQITATMNYPNGYNKNNCVILSAEMIGGTTASGDVYTVGSTFSSIDLSRGGCSCAVSLLTNQISISARQILLTDGVSPTITDIGSVSKYRIVLLKIS